MRFSTPFIFDLKNPTWAPYEEAKTVWRRFSFWQRFSQQAYQKRNLIFSKIGCPRSRWLRWHRVGIVIDFADMCWNSHWLYVCTIVHDVGIVNKRTQCQHSRWRHGQWTRCQRSQLLCTMQTCCRHSKRLQGHKQDYGDTFGKLWRLLTDFIGTICIFKPRL